MDKHIDSAAQDSNGRINPFMIGYEAETALAYREGQEKGLEHCIREREKHHKAMLKAREDTNGGALFDSEEKALEVVLANSRLAGYEKAAAEHRKEAVEKEQAEKIMEYNGIDADRMPAEYRHMAHRVVPYSQQFAAGIKATAGVEPGTEEFRRKIVEGFKMGFDVANPIRPMEGQRARSIMATTFQTTAWEPNKMYEPGWIPMHGGEHLPIQVVDLLPSGPMAGKNVSWWEETTYDNNAAGRAENAQAAESAYAMTERSAVPVSVAHRLPITEESLEDRMELDRYVDVVMPLGVLQKIDQQVQTGDGSSNTLKGFVKGYVSDPAYLPASDIDVFKLTDGTLSGDNLDPNSLRNPWDILLDMKLESMDHGYGILGLQMPNVCVINLKLWGAMLKSKPGHQAFGTGADGGNPKLPATDHAGYYIGGPQSGSLFNTPWGMTLRVSNQMVLTKSANAGPNFNFSAFIFDNSPMFSKLCYRHGINVRFGLDGSDFSHFRVTVRAEARLAFILYRKKAFMGLVNPVSAGTAPSD